MATDGSRDAGLGLQAASRLLRKADQRVGVLCFAPEFQLPSIRGGESSGKASRLKEKYEQRLGRETDAIVQSALDMLRGEGTTAERLTEIGSPPEVIVRIGEKYDLTEMGAKGHADQTRLGPRASCKPCSRAITPARFNRPGIDGRPILPTYHGNSFDNPEFNDKLNGVK